MSEINAVGPLRVVSGHAPIRRLGGLLSSFSESCGQAGVSNDLGYFLSKPGALPRVPHLLLIHKPGADAQDLSPDSLLGAVLIFEQKIAGIGLRVFTTADRSGRGSVIAREHDRVYIAAFAAAWLMRNLAHLVLMTFSGVENSSSESALASSLACLGLGRHIHWASRERNISAFLPVPSTLEGAYALLGARTRRNLRYYRRRLESELGAVFVPEVSIPREEFLAFNRDCMYPVSSSVAAWRQTALQDLEQPVCMGLKDKTGRWLSLLGSRRYMDRSEILWQMNRAGLPQYSLGTAMRAYWIEHEITHGARRLYASGGTQHSMSHAFVPEPVVDLIVRRDTLVGRAMRWLGRRYMPAGNELTETFNSPDLEWRNC